MRTKDNKYDDTDRYTDVQNQAYADDQSDFMLDKMKQGCNINEAIILLNFYNNGNTKTKDPGKEK